MLFNYRLHSILLWRAFQYLYYLCHTYFWPPTTLCLKRGEATPYRLMLHFDCCSLTLDWLTLYIVFLWCISAALLVPEKKPDSIGNVWQYEEKHLLCSSAEKPLSLSVDMTSCMPKWNVRKYWLSQWKLGWRRLKEMKQSRGCAEKTMQCINLVGWEKTAYLCVREMASFSINEMTSYFRKCQTEASTGEARK